MEVEFNASLVGANAPEIELPLEFVSVGERTVKQYHPIARHPQKYRRLIAAGRDFLGVREYRTHARMRHICLGSHVRSHDGALRTVGNCKSHCRWSHMRGL